MQWLSCSPGSAGASLTCTWHLLLHHSSGSFWASLSLGGPLSKHLSLQDLKLSPLLRLKKQLCEELFCFTQTSSTETRTGKAFSLEAQLLVSSRLGSPSTPFSSCCSLGTSLSSSSLSVRDQTPAEPWKLEQTSTPRALQFRLPSDRAAFCD